MKRNTMRKKLLLGTVALMAGVGLASAQAMREGAGAAAGGTVGAEHGTSGSPGAKTHGEAWAQRGTESQNKGKSETRGEGATEQKAQASKAEKGRMSKQAKPERSTPGQGSSERDNMKPPGRKIRKRR